MTQQLKVPAIWPDNLGLIPGTHMVEEDNQLTQNVFWSLYMHRKKC